MIEKLKKLGIILTIAILFTIFVFAMTNAIYPTPEYDNYCDTNMRDVSEAVALEKIPARDICYDNYDLAREKHDMVLFIVSSISGVAAILFGLYYKKKDAFWDLVRSGFLVGGLIALFVGTFVYYSDMARFMRPAVILIELLIVLLVTYKVIKKKK